MRVTRTVGSWLCTLLMLTLASAAAAHQTQAPYLSVLGDKVERLPLTLTAVEASIVGVIADVKVKQIYENRGTAPIEAIYVFPASDRAAVQGLTMKVGDRVVRATIRTKEMAKAEYEQAKSEGKTTSLLEQLDPSVFRMNVANVLPGDRVEVELHYSELLIPEAGTYEFFFPNTMGQPYGPADAPGVANPKSREAEVVDYSFSLHVQVNAGIPLAELTSPSHDVEVARPNANAADITLSDAAIRKAGAKDFVLRYSLAGKRIQTGILAYPEGDGGYFLLLAQPPGNIPDTAIAPREFIFVVDVSGSMIGEPLDLAKRLVGDLFSVLRPSDRFNVVLFSGGSRVLAPNGSLPATPDTLQRVQAAITDQNAGGGTELVPALETAFGLPPTPGFARSIVIVTDGQISAGPEAYATVRQHLDSANVFAFGVGANVLRPTIALLARGGAGEPFIVESMDKGADVAAKLRRYIDRPLLTHAKLETNGFEVSDLLPATLPDLLAERPIVVVGRYRGKAQGALRIRGLSGSTDFNEEVHVDPAAVSTQLGALRILWARTRLQELMDGQASDSWSGNTFANKNEAPITELGLQYELLTPYTSFVAVDQRVRSDGQAVPVEQPAIAKPAAIRRGVGNYVGLDRRRNVRPDAPSVESSQREVDGYRLVLQGSCWTDVSYVRSMPLLRIRRDSAAYTRLLALAPQLATVLALGDQVLVVINGTAIRVGPEGFGDYSEALLQRVLTQRR